MSTTYPMSEPFRATVTQSPKLARIERVRSEQVTFGKPACHAAGFYGLLFRISTCTHVLQVLLQRTPRRFTQILLQCRMNSLTRRAWANKPYVAAKSRPGIENGKKVATEPPW